MYSEPLYTPHQHRVSELIECQQCGNITRVRVTYIDGDCDAELGNCGCCGASFFNDFDDEEKQ